jgi:hypothetical protein
MMAGMEISRLFAFDSSHMHTICFSHIQAMKTHTFGALTEVSFQIVISMCSDFWRLGYHWACLYNSTHWRYADKLLRITRRRIACFCAGLRSGRSLEQQGTGSCPSTRPPSISKQSTSNSFNVFLATPCIIAWSRKP